MAVATHLNTHTFPMLQMCAMFQSSELDWTRATGLQLIVAVDSCL